MTRICTNVELIDSEQLSKSPAIIEVKNRINQRIQSAVDVAEPSDEINEQLGGTAAGAERHDHVREKEGQPANDENSHYDTEGPRGPSLLRQRNPLPLLDELINRGGGYRGRRGRQATPVLLVLMMMMAAPDGRGRGHGEGAHLRRRVLVLEQLVVHALDGHGLPARGLWDRGRLLVVIGLAADRVLGLVDLVKPGRGHGPESRLSRSLPESTTRREEDLQVDEAHQQKGNEEAAQRRVDDVALAPGELTGRARQEFLGPVVPARQGRRTDGPGKDPDPSYRADDTFDGALLGVVDRVGYGPVAVQRYGAEIEDAGGAAEDVAGQPELADVNAEDPLVEDQVGDVEGHDENGDGEVRHGQRNDEEVLDDAQGPVGEYGQDDQAIAQDCQDYQEAESDDNRGGLKGR